MRFFGKIAIIVSFFGFSLCSQPANSQTVQKLKAGKKPGPNYTPVVHYITPVPTPTPKPRKPLRHVNSGLSSVTAPEKYARKVVTEIPKETLFQFLRSDGPAGALNAELQRAATQQYLCDIHGFHHMAFRVDANENSYLQFRKTVRVFDKKGNMVRTIAKTFQENRMLVDEEGNMLLYSRSLLPPTGRIYDSKGDLIEKPDFTNIKSSDLECAGFSHGVLYSNRENGVIHKLPGADEKKINLRISPGKSRKVVNFPLVIDGYSLGELITVDNAGNSYWKYREPDDSWPVEEICHTYKFDSDGNLLAGFDFLPQFINEETQTLYHWEFSKDGASLVKWEKEKS